MVLSQLPSLSSPPSLSLSFLLFSPTPFLSPILPYPFFLLLLLLSSIFPAFPLSFLLCPPEYSCSLSSLPQWWEVLKHCLISRLVSVLVSSWSWRYFLGLGLYGHCVGLGLRLALNVSVLVSWDLDSSRHLVTEEMHQWQLIATSYLFTCSRTTGGRKPWRLHSVVYGDCHKEDRTTWCIKIHGKSLCYYSACTLTMGQTDTQLLHITYRMVTMVTRAVRMTTYYCGGPQLPTKDTTIRRGIRGKGEWCTQLMPIRPFEPEGWCEPLARSREGTVGYYHV